LSYPASVRVARQKKISRIPFQQGTAKLKRFQVVLRGIGLKDLAIANNLLVLKHKVPHFFGLVGNNMTNGFGSEGFGKRKLLWLLQGGLDFA